MRSTLLRPESATFDFILRLDLAWLVGSSGAGTGAGGAGVSVLVLSVGGLEEVGGLTPSLSSLVSVLLLLLLLLVVVLVLTGPGLAVLSLAWL